MTIALFILPSQQISLTFTEQFIFPFGFLISLLSFCVVAFDEDFEAELTDNCDARTEVSVLSRSLDPELTDVSY